MQSVSIADVFEKVVAFSHDPILLIDREGKHLVVNKAAADLFYMPQEALIGHSPQELFDGGLVDRVTSLEALRTKRVVAEIVYVRGKPCFSTSIPIFDETGEVQMVLTNSRSSDTLNEFTRKLAYERKQHSRFREISQYLTTMNDQGLVCESARMKAVVERCTIIAPTDSAVMLLGESGSGKDVLARFIHHISARNEQTFIPVNCAAIPPELFEAEFFGYVPGAFTGARRDGRIGLVQMADRGTIFLDELGELPLPMQSKLLRFLESGEFFPIGSSKARHADVRVISATNRNLSQMVSEKAFREDLYYRLNVIPLHVPPLRERPEDVRALAEVFLMNFNKKYGFHVSLTEEEIALLERQRWLGNARELRNTIERFVLLSAGPKKVDFESILPDFPQKEFSVMPPTLRLPEQTAEQPLRSLEDVTEEFQRRYIRYAVQRTNGSIGAAAEALRVHRTTVYRKLREE